MEHQEHDWDRQHEQLSALLDDELTEGERAALEAHLATCAQCRAELASLRRTRALVRALPQPTLPHAFALPLATPAAQETPHQAVPAARRSSGASPTRLAPRSRQVRTLQWISAIAAVLGILLLLPAIFPIASLGESTTANSATTSAKVPVGNGQLGSSATPSPIRTSSAHPGIDTPAPTTAQPGATPGQNGGGGQPFNGTTSSPGGSPIGALLSTTNLGLLLLTLGVCGFALAWALRRRWQRLTR